MIDLGSVAALYEHQHELHGCCLRCDRWRLLDLAGMVGEGKGSLRLPFASDVPRLRRGRVATGASSDAGAKLEPPRGRTSAENVTRASVGSPVEFCELQLRYE